MVDDGGNVESVTVRLYGPNTDYVIDRQRELHVSVRFSTDLFETQLASFVNLSLVKVMIAFQRVRLSN